METVNRYNYGRLRGLIREHFGTLANFAKALGISMTALNDRLQNRVVFGQDEIEKAIELLHLEYSEIAGVFFARE